MFHWYLANGDGTADRFDDTPAICERVDRSHYSGEQWFGSPEGAIKHGRVKACAFKRTVEPTYDAAKWLETGVMVHAGELVSIEITASWRGE